MDVGAAVKPFTMSSMYPSMVTLKFYPTYRGWIAPYHFANGGGVSVASHYAFVEQALVHTVAHVSQAQLMVPS